MGTQAKVEHVKTALNESPSEKEGKYSTKEKTCLLLHPQ